MIATTKRKSLNLNVMFNNLNKELGVVVITGTEAVKFLQGQLTCNTEHLLLKKESVLDFNHLHATFAAALNPKGRIIANFIISYQDSSFYLLLPLEQCQLLKNHLQKYILRAKVEIHLRLDLNILFSDKLVLYKKYNLEEDSDINLVISLNDSSSIFLTKNRPLNNIKFNSELDARIAWYQFLIENKIPLIYNITTEKFVPQNINFENLGGVSFNKGCYVGQEVVNRLHNLGTPSKKLFFITLNFTDNLDITINRGDTLTSQEFDNQEIGVIIEILDNRALASLLVKAINSKIFLTNNENISITVTNDNN